MRKHALQLVDGVKAYLVPAGLSACHPPEAAPA